MWVFIPMGYFKLFGWQLAVGSWREIASLFLALRIVKSGTYRTK